MALAVASVFPPRPKISGSKKIISQTTTTSTMQNPKRSIEMPADKHSKKLKIDRNEKNAERDNQGNHGSTSKSVGESNRNIIGFDLEARIQAFVRAREGNVNRKSSLEDGGMEEEDMDDEDEVAHIQEATPIQQLEFGKRKRGRPRKNENEKAQDSGKSVEVMGKKHRGRPPRDKGKAVEKVDYGQRLDFFSKGARRKKIVDEEEFDDELEDELEDEEDEEYADISGDDDNLSLNESNIDEDLESESEDESDAELIGKSRSKRTEDNRNNFDYRTTKESVVAKGKQKEVIEDSESPIIPPVLYDEYWDEEDEQELQEGWSEEDDKLLKKGETEIALWKKTLNIFRQPPQELLGAITVDTSGNKKEGNKDWPHDFCIQLGNVVCCVAFKDRPEYLRYVLRLTLSLRLGLSKGFKEPSKKSMSAQRNRKITEGLNAKLELPIDEKIEEALNVTLNEQLGPDLPPHMDFLKVLRKIVRKTKQDCLGLIKSDLANIINAWDTYAEGAKAQGLMSMVEYRKDWDERIKGRTSTENPAKKYSTVAIKGLMKDRILAQRRAAIREQRIERNIVERREEEDEESTSEVFGEETPRERGFQRNHQAPSPIL